MWKYSELSNFHKTWNVIHGLKYQIEEKLSSEMLRKNFYGSPLPPFYAIVRAKVIQPEKHLAPVTKGNFLAHAQ